MPLVNIQSSRKFIELYDIRVTHTAIKENTAGKAWREKEIID
jgi:hypothetical protein